MSYAVITTPFNSSDADRQALKHAASLAGLEVLRIINAPTAVGLAHKLDQKMGENNITVIDLGAEALRVTVSEIDEGVFGVLSGSEVHELGGDAYNKRILDWLIEKTEKENIGVAQLEPVQEADRIKRVLSNNTGTEVSQDPSINAGALQHTLSRDELQRMTQDLVDRSATEIERVLSLAGIDATTIEHLSDQFPSLWISSLIMRVGVTYWGI